MKRFSGRLAACACAIATLISPQASASLVNNGDGSFSDTDTGYLWRTLAQYDGRDFASAVALLPSDYHVASAAEVATLTAAAPANPGTFAADLAAMGANPASGILWGFYGTGTTYLWNDGYSAAWASNAANSYGWDNWNYAVAPTDQFEGLSLFAVNTLPAEATVPEPATLALIALGAAGLLLPRRRAAPLQP